MLGPTADSTRPRPADVSRSGLPMHDHAFRVTASSRNSGCRFRGRCSPYLRPAPACDRVEIVQGLLIRMAPAALAAAAWPTAGARHLHTCCTGDGLSTCFQQALGGMPRCFRTVEPEDHLGSRQWNCNDGSPPPVSSGHLAEPHRASLIASGSGGVQEWSPTPPGFIWPHPEARTSNLSYS